LQAKLERTHHKQKKPKINRLENKRDQMVDRKQIPSIYGE
jgi:hypothetical protein